MKQNNGDFFRSVRFGGFRKEDVMRYIEQQETKLHAQAQRLDEQELSLRTQRRLRFEAQRQFRLARRRDSAALEVRGELRELRQLLEEARGLAGELEQENMHLRRRIRLLEQPQREEQEGLPFDQLTFRLFLEDWDEDDESEFGYLSMKE
ncbi:MAG: hypothetical protein FWH26_07760 [Oscillospiraceae bacterium]|nr:hypothetical protein [Oscillospiraceae bacterium]